MIHAGRIVKTKGKAHLESPTKSLTASRTPPPLQDRTGAHPITTKEMTISLAAYESNDSVLYEHVHYYERIRVFHAIWNEQSVFHFRVAVGHEKVCGIQASQNRCEIRNDKASCTFTRSSAISIPFSGKKASPLRVSHNRCFLLSPQMECGRSNESRPTYTQAARA